MRIQILGLFHDSKRPHTTGNKISVLRNVFCLGEHLLELHAAGNEISTADLRGLHKLALLDLADNRSMPLCCCASRCLAVVCVYLALEGQDESDEIVRIGLQAWCICKASQSC